MEANALVVLALLFSIYWLGYAIGLRVGRDREKFK